MVLQDIPRSDVWLSASKSCHDGNHVAVYNADVSVICHSALVKTICNGSLNHNHNRRVLLVTISEVSNYSTCQRTYAGLYEYVGRSFSQLVCSLIRHGSITFHDPCRNLLIALPSGILYYDSVLFLLGKSCSLSYTLVIVYIGNPCLGILSLDVVQTGLSGTLRHDDYTVLS